MSPSELSQTSRGTAGTAATSRAISLLDNIKQNTKPSENQEFIRILSLFKQKRISSTEAFERVSLVLQNYPALLNEFKSYLPPSSNVGVGQQQQSAPSQSKYILQNSVNNINYGSTSTINQQDHHPLSNDSQRHSQAVGDYTDDEPEYSSYYKPAQFSNALAFVQKVKKTYFNDPEVYDKFLTLLKNYQRGAVSQQEVVVSVESLLSRTPGLALEFKQHYGASTPGEGGAEPHSLPRADSNETFIHFPKQTNPQTYQQPRTLSFASSVPVTSIATVTPENYASSERDPLLVPATASLSQPAVVNTRLTRDTEAQLLQDSQLSSSRVAKYYSPVTLAVFYFTLFLVLFVGALGAAFYFGVLDLSFFEAGR